MAGNRGFADAVASGTGQGARSALPPRTGVLESRNNRLSELAARQTVLREQELVDPARCRIWKGHNRDYDLLNEQTCADLIESFTAQGRQEVPAIVRRVRGAAPIEFEVICGARRHWSVTWMRAHGHPDFKFLVEPRELSDEEAFRVADLENRSRRDLSDIERARDYARALVRYYDGNQGRMAERLEVSQSWLSRYLELARIPAEVVDAFGGPHAIRISHAAVLAPLMKHPAQGVAVLEAARTLAGEQKATKGQGGAPLPPPAVLQRLRAASRPQRRTAARSEQAHVVRAPDGAIVARGERAARGGALTIALPSAAGRRTEDLLAAVREILERLSAEMPRPMSTVRTARRSASSST